jgi:hypothetical protein
LTDLRRWLDARQPPPPPSLRTALDEAVVKWDPQQGGVPVRLAAVGLEVLAQVVRAPATRADALTLLAADALITYACEAAFDDDPAERGDPVEAVLDALDMGRFGRLAAGEAVQ